MTLSAQEAQRIFDAAERLCSEAEVAAAVERLAREITARLHDEHPLILAVMTGAIVFAGQLLPKLAFPLELDYVHCTRYRGATSGGELSWIVPPKDALRGRTVLVVDDILDEGHTLAAIKQRVLEIGARACLIAVLADKDIGKPKPVTADFVGFELPNRYVFGFGMDVKRAWRNLPAIYASRE